MTNIFGALTVEETVHGTEIQMTGEIDVAVVRMSASAVNDLLCTPPSRLDVDASGVTFIDSSGIATLIKLYAATTGAGGAFRLHRPSAPVVRLLDACRLLELFEIRAVHRPPAVPA